MPDVPVNPVPEMPVQVDTNKKSSGVIAPNILWTLYYRQGGNPHPMNLNFEFPNDLRRAIDRGRKHCEIMTYKFTSVRPFLTSLADEEAKKSDS